MDQSAESVHSGASDWLCETRGIKRWKGKVSSVPPTPIAHATKHLIVQRFLFSVCTSRLAKRAQRDVDLNFEYSDLIQHSDRKGPSSHEQPTPMGGS